MKKPAQTTAEAFEDVRVAAQRFGEEIRAVFFPERIRKVYSQHRAWSDATFGTKVEKGPIGPLKHLKKECNEAIDAPDDILEFADMQFLLWDAAHRAGHTLPELIAACEAKLTVLKTRTYPKVADGEPSFHVKDGGE